MTAVPAQRRRYDDESLAYAAEVGRRIRALRESRGLALADIREAWGVTGVTLGSYERGDRHLTVAALSRIARSAGVEVASLLPRTGGAPALDHHEEAAVLRRIADRIENAEVSR